MAPPWACKRRLQCVIFLLAVQNPVRSIFSHRRRSRAPLRCLPLGPQCVVLLADLADTGVDAVDIVRRHGVTYQFVLVTQLRWGARMPQAARSNMRSASASV